MDSAGKCFGKSRKERSFKSIVLYPFPAELDGVSLQGDFLYRGLKENGYNAVACDRRASFEKDYFLHSNGFDVAIGIGFWGDTPRIITYPMERGIQPVPWLNADGWVANYHDILNSLPLIMVTSNWVRETYMRDGVHNPSIFPMPIGIDTAQMAPIEKSNPNVQMMRRMLGVKPHEKLILTIGGDTTSKGFQEVLRALAKINSDFPNWKYVGKSWELNKPSYHHREELRIIRENKLPRKRIKYIGGPVSRETMRLLISAADVYAAPSRIEGFGMIQVEAQSCGIPVLAIDAMGVKDTIVHGKTGYLAKVAATVDLEQEWVYREMGFRKKQIIKFDHPKTFAYRADVDELADYLLKMLGDDVLRKEMGEAARQHVLKNFDYHKVSLDIAHLIESKLNL